MTTATVKPVASKGHAEHTKEADSQSGLPGKFTRPIKLTFLGAGSGFCPKLVSDVMQIPGAERGEIALVDIDTTRLSTMKQLIGKVIDLNGRSEGWNVTASPNRREVMAGSDYLVCCVEVSGVACVAWDNDIPLKYGIDQCIGDTIGPGGLFKALRTVPVFLDILRDVAELCPQAIMLNYTNPMNIMCLSAGRAVPQVPVVGLCHSVQGSSHVLSRRLGIAYNEMGWDCAGINHLAWFTKVEHQGRDQYPRLMAQAQAELYGKIETSDNADANDRGNDLVRKDMMLHFGAYITESSGHLSEYLPYYRKSVEGKRYLKDKYEGGSRFYANEWPTWRKNADADRMAMVRGEKEINWKRSWEYASWIIEAREKDAPFRIHGNMMNAARDSYGAGRGQLITNLPADGCVEVACMVDRNGINPTRYGALPPQMAQICQSNMAMFDLAANACINKSKDAAVHALLLDPLTAAMCTPHQIKQMTLEIFDAEKDYLPGYR